MTLGLAPAPKLPAGMLPTAVGARLAVTVTVNVWAKLNRPSLAVTATVPLPVATPVIFTVDPDALAVTLLAVSELAP